MARTFPLEKVILQSWVRSGGLSGRLHPKLADEISRRIFWLIAARALILLLGLNLARPLEILPGQLGSLPFLPLCNCFAAGSALSYLAFWWSGRRPVLQLYLQIAIDLCSTTFLVAHTHGSESPFVSFYLLIIIYCGLTLGRNCGIVSAAISSTLYAGTIVLNDVGTSSFQGGFPGLLPLTFRLSLHALGFFSVAFLGAVLSQRLHAVQKELENKTDSLVQLQRLTKDIVSSIRSGLLTTDLNGDVTLFNAAAEEITGRPRSEVINGSVRSVIGDALWSKIGSADLFRDARPLRHQEWLGLPGGSRRYLGYSVSPLLNQDAVLIGYVISFQDLTEIKRLEEEVRVKDRMAAVGQMAAGIAHEIRNPLAAMRGSVEILHSHLSVKGSDERLIEILVRESDRLNKFVEDFLVFARPARTERQPVDLTGLLRDWALLLKNSPELRKDHIVDLRVPAGSALVAGDPDKLRQVFWNLAQNGLRAMPSGGRLTIAVRAAVNGSCEIAFEDTGVGMTEEERAQLFQPFQAKFSGGTGLGLSIIFQIVEDHRGKIRFDSEKGHGTRVTIELPAWRATGLSEPASRGLSPDENILPAA